MSKDESLVDDLKPILWKWLVRLIWLGSIGFFQTLELIRYVNGQTYRPFFALYAAVLAAFVAWFAVKAASVVFRSRERH
ncbi:hypothetical protein [Bradyrhizobium sp. Leo121]|uniref:hypothetical protein n=1 Tax=Bradyrhizobium sp. Leo121 TaxID=1571195 RepID=UPI001029BC90|nr:hypothetical protein [Bradyrhizobium sp. Leo121]RZN13238.1 hypothetical protein CWO90_45315 [Bradyrhizobium sp. Leo121]